MKDNIYIETNKMANEKLIKSILEGVNKPKVDTEFDIIYRAENLLLLAPKTRSAACKYGSGTKWCSSNPDRDPNWWGTIENIRKTGILYYLILYKDTPEGKIEDYKFAIEKQVATGSERWNDISGKRISNMELVKKFILTDPMVEQKIDDYWKENRVQWKPKFKIGDYVKPKYRGGDTTFKDIHGRGEVSTYWNNCIYLVVGENKSSIVVQLVRIKPEMLNLTTNNWAYKGIEAVKTALQQHWVLRKNVNPYNFEILSNPNE